MEKGIKNTSDSNRSLYLCQNKAIHKARAQIGMSLCDCRLLAKQLGKKTSLSSLTLRRRWEVIEILKAKPDWKIVDKCLGFAYNYATYIIDIIQGTGVDPDKVADGITHFVKLYKDDMKAKQAA